MNKKLFALLIVLMTLSLLGIIFVQGYWISNSYRTNDEQFSINVKQILTTTSRAIQRREIDYYFDIYDKLIEDAESPESVTMNQLMYRIDTENSEETIIYSDGILQEDYKLSYSFLDTEIDSIQFKKLTNSKSTTKISPSLDGTDKSKVTKMTLTRMRDFERSQFEEAFVNISAKRPIHKRVTVNQIEELISEELNARGLSSQFEFAVYSNRLATKVRSRKFDLAPATTYSVPLFVNEDLGSNYLLYVNFSGKEKEVLNSILGMALLSLTFTSVIVLAYASALSQIFRQRQISQIKTDFINNMTHEFKTPIATIKLALDALKNPKVKNDEEFLTRYLGMIGEENKRMHAQVENVLRISKLEKNEIDVPKERIELHDIVVDAITHVSLIVESRGGYINTHFNAHKSSILGNELHLTNVIVNMLDNAIKYTDGVPKIDVYTENVKNNIILRIVDHGIGMSKAVQKRIFEKFYREHTGDIHNVKGHGLGLAYVKRILDDHDAQISVESEKDKGSTFIINLHLIS
jgi:two-component system phosphate regulon sensor histidine kinase PhoR